MVFAGMRIRTYLRMGTEGDRSLPSRLFLRNAGKNSRGGVRPL